MKVNSKIGFGDFFRLLVTTSPINKGNKKGDVETRKLGILEI